MSQFSDHATDYNRDEGPLSFPTVVTPDAQWQLASGMARIHQATLTPSKQQLLSEYASSVPGLAHASASDISLLGAYRFDDPAGEVGIECHILGSADGDVIHLPVVYRAEPIEGWDDVLVGTLEHSVLGTRWVYEACGDPIFVQELVATIVTGGTQVELVVETDGGTVVREPTATVVGTGVPGTVVPAIGTVLAKREGTNTVISTGGLKVVIRHVVTDPGPVDGPRLLGTWPGGQATLAFI